MNIRFITTEHLKKGLWFRDDEDYRAGMNYVAIAAYAVGVAILSFVLMSNHVHFLVIGDDTSALGFINEFKRRYSKYYQKKYGIQKFLRGNGVEISSVPLDGESVERTIAYIHMNPVAANVCISSTLYPWGSGNVFFSSVPCGIRHLSDYSFREQYKLLRTRDSLPGQYLMSDEEYILPQSYINVRFVETLYRSPKRMNYFLLNSSKARMRMEEKTMPSFQDQTILKFARDLCISLFRKDNWNHLEEKDVGVFIRQMKYRCSADIGQLARVLEIPYEVLSRHLEP